MYIPRLALNQSLLEESLQKRGRSEGWQFLCVPDRARYRGNAYQLWGKFICWYKSNCQAVFGTWQLKEVSFWNQCFRCRRSPDWLKREEGCREWGCQACAGRGRWSEGSSAEETSVNCKWLIKAPLWLSDKSCVISHFLTGQSLPPIDCDGFTLDSKPCFQTGLLLLFLKIKHWLSSEKGRCFLVFWHLCSWFSCQCFLKFTCKMLLCQCAL